jgi:hypothetical protein
LCFYVTDSGEFQRRRRTDANTDLIRIDWVDSEALLNAPLRKTQAWKQAIAPWLDQHLACLLANIARMPERPALPGDDSLNRILPCAG